MVEESESFVTPVDFPTPCKVKPIYFHKFNLKKDFRVVSIYSYLYSYTRMYISSQVIGVEWVMVLTPKVAEKRVSTLMTTSCLLPVEEGLIIRDIEVSL